MMAKRKNSKATSAPSALKTTLATSLGSVVGTAALVGTHHYYRRRQQPEARFQDYLTGVQARLNAASLRPLARLQYASKQAAQTWQQAYLDYQNHSSRNSSTNKFADVHTTTMLARQVSWVSGVASMPKNISLISDDEDHGFGVVGIDADRHLVWQATMPERVHDIVVQPFNKDVQDHVPRHVVVMGRRPSECFWVLDTATGQVQFAITAASDRHFYGHACYSLDGKFLYVTENDTVSLDGKIGVYDADKAYQKVGEFDSHGIGPHELIMHPDGDILAIANGGIMTEQASREELNLDSMRPSLAYLNRHTGALLEQITPEHNQMSIRHLAMHADGRVMIGIQFQGARHINVPLVLTHQRGDSEFTPLTMPNNGWQRFHQYIASVAVDSASNILCVTTPIGGCSALFDLDTYQLIDSVNLPDCAGAAVNMGTQCGFIISDGQGKLTTIQAVDRTSVMTDSAPHKMSFDNHLQALESF